MYQLVRFYKISSIKNDSEKRLHVINNATEPLLLLLLLLLLFQ
jgi:hypothetical protein